MRVGICRAASGRNRVRNGQGRSRAAGVGPSTFAAGLAFCVALAACGASEEPTAGTTGSAPSAVEAAPSEASGPVRTEKVAGLQYVVPTAWSAEQPASSMRAAQYALPGDAGEAQLVLFRFPGGGGSADANVARWISQFSQPDGSSSQDRAQVQNATVNGLQVTRLDVRGTYGGQQMPGAPPQPAIEDGRLLALVVEGPGDPYFFKLLGPASTVARWESDFDALAQSLATE